MATTNTCWFVQHVFTALLSFVGHQLHGDAVIANMIFSQEVVYVLDNLFLWLKHDSTCLGTLVVKTVEHIVLKVHMYCVGIPHIHQRLVFGAWCLENGLWEHSSLKRELLRKLPKSFDSITLLQENKQDWWFQLGGATAHTAKTATAFLQNFFGNCIVEFGLWPLWSPDLMLPDFCLWGFLTESAYSHNPRSVEDLEL